MTAMCYNGFRVYRFPLSSEEVQKKFTQFFRMPPEDDLYENSPERSVLLSTIGSSMQTCLGHQSQKWDTGENC